MLLLVPRVPAGEEHDGRLPVVGAVVLEAVHAEAVLPAAVEEAPTPSHWIPVLMGGRGRREGGREGGRKPSVLH